MATSTFSYRPFIGDLDITESLDAEALKKQFADLPAAAPTLREALKEAGIPNTKSTLKHSMELVNRARENPEIAALGLTDDEAGAISCYTLEGAEGAKSPYEAINEGLAGSRKRKNLPAARKLIHLFLSGLRKLPRFRASRGQVLYRGVSVKVPTAQDEAGKHQYYAKGRTVTWWGFTSTTTDLEVARSSTRGAEESTLFKICGEDVWGYDIRAFSRVPGEEEVVLEPEARVVVESVLTRGAVTTVKVVLQKPGRLVLEDIVPVRAPKPAASQKRRSILFDRGFERGWDSVWRKCPDDVDGARKYHVSWKNHRVAKIKGEGEDYCTVIGGTPLPPDAVTSWSVRVLSSANNDGKLVYVGVAPSCIDQDERANYDRCGWYFYCYRSTLWSGPPHGYSGKKYGPRGRVGEYVRTGDSIGVVMDTAKGELSFVVNGVNLGVAYEGIPLDKPLVPCVILRNKGDAVELDTAEARENVDYTIPTPTKITGKNGITWDSVSLGWCKVEGASFYQVEVDESKFYDISAQKAFTKRGLLPCTEHSFRVRTVRGGAVSEWSAAVKGRTQMAPEFAECAWRECPGDVSEELRYAVDESSPMVATKTGGGGAVLGHCCTVVGDAPLPADAAASWSVRVLKAKHHGEGIYVGVAPFDINQNEDGNHRSCGWYFSCCHSTLCSGRPHEYDDKEYGPKKRGKDEKRVHNGDSIGVAMDTAKGELSFIVDGVNLGVAYEGIPLDKPLVPCVLIGHKKDSVELLL